MMLKKELTLNSESALQRVYSYSLSCTFYEQDSQWLHFWRGFCYTVQHD